MVTNTVSDLFRGRRDAESAFAECAFDAALEHGHEPSHINFVLTDGTR